jgi:predicted regulator of Ras-like GTPase activity (Roadblock/LC7/MglB family)
VSAPPRSSAFAGLSHRIPSAMGSEFGLVIENLMAVPGSMGAVLVDEDGYAIDYVHDPATLAELDVQLLGAQLGQIVALTTRSAAKLDLGTPVVLLEGDRANLIVGPVGIIYVLAFMLRCETDMMQALHHFEAVRSTVEHLLT